MSRIGKNIIEIPEKVDITFVAGELSIKGPKGDITRKIRGEVLVDLGEKELSFKIKSSNKVSRSLWGTYASHAKNMIQGVLDGHEKSLSVEGIGYRVALEGNEMVLHLGFSHPVRVKVEEGLSVEVEKNIIKISGVDKEQVGAFAAKVRDIKKPEPYKGKGIRYVGEVVRRKQGKKGSD